MNQVLIVRAFLSECMIRNSNANLYLAVVVVFVTEIKANSSSSGITDASELGGVFECCMSPALTWSSSTGIINIVDVGSTSERYLNECRIVIRLV
jgi:hypothetical protein